jgi:hypothetical protein
MTRNEILDFMKAHRDELRQTFGVQEIAVELSEERKTLTKTYWLFGHVPVAATGRSA